MVKRTTPEEIAARAARSKQRRKKTATVAPSHDPVVTLRAQKNEEEEKKQEQNPTSTEPGRDTTYTAADAADAALDATLLDANLATRGIPTPSPSPTGCFNFVKSIRSAISNALGL